MISVRNTGLRNINIIRKGVHHMIKLVMGLKGTGKTKELISTVNSVAKTAEGSVICLERDDKLRYEIDPKVRLISTDEYGINDYDMFFGFIGGLRASNYDITEIFVDSITKICRSDNVEELETFLDELEAIADGIDFFITVSMDISLATPKIQKYL